MWRSILILCRYHLSLVEGFSNNQACVSYERSMGQVGMTVKECLAFFDQDQAC